MILRFACGWLLFTAASSSGADPIAAQLQPLVDHHTIAGAVTLVATADQILDESTVGYADLASKKPMSPDTLFFIASMTKPMTATALMMLVDEGKVKLDDPVEKYLPEFHGVRVRGANGGQPQPATAPMPVRELLTHTSGLSYLNPKMEEPREDAQPLADRVRGYAAQPLVSQPGTRYLYSNEGINTAGRIIEVASGMPYEQFMKTRLFTPLGMTDSSFFPTAAQVARLATIYTPTADEKSLVPTPMDHMGYPLDGPGRYAIPARGVITSAADLLKFCRMILAGGVGPDGHRLVSAASVRAMTTNEEPPTERGTYGYGFCFAPPDLIGHGGSTGTRMYVDPARGRIQIFLVQGLRGWPNGVKDPYAVFGAAVKAMP